MFKTSISTIFIFSVRGRKISMNSKLNIPKKLKDESLEEEVIRLRAENAYLKSGMATLF
ncbi:hypothetical protein EfmAA290_08440 [Enterococcus faecium]|nr:hypothetical protein EfmAA290_08440 [Enterococcus faecium]